MKISIIGTRLHLLNIILKQRKLQHLCNLNIYWSFIKINHEFYKITSISYFNYISIPHTFSDSKSCDNIYANLSIRFNEIGIQITSRILK